MILNSTDWLIIAGYFIFSLGIGLYASRRAGQNSAEFFLSGRNMPWWLLGVSMVATTFSTDTPNLVTDIVRQKGVAGNWKWWAFLLTGMLTVFVYARLWRRSGVLTDLGFYEMRYSGKGAAFLRGFRAVYLGLLFNVMVLSMISLALVKIGTVMLNWSPLQILLVASLITLIYSTFGGLRGILLTDFFQFLLAMTGSVGAAIILIKLPEIGGLQRLIHHPDVLPKISLLPDFTSGQNVMMLFILPLAVQWWSVWYPGSEPGGGGYIAQRMLSARTEQGATNATLLFNVAHYALRPWPWILVALMSLIIFPDLASLHEAFPNADPSIVKHDLAYPAMLTLLPNGFLGLVVASLFAAFMSTASTHLNWGSSYLVHDFYQRFIRPGATEKRLVLAGRVSTVLLMLLSMGLALLLENALQAFDMLIQIGAGTGLIYILRWYWWRVNAYSEISGMIISFCIACYFEFIHPLTGLPVLAAPLKMVIGVALTTCVWLLVTFSTKPTDQQILRSFYRCVHPGGPGWRKVIRDACKENDNFRALLHEPSGIPEGIVCMVLGCLAVYSILFATGNWIYGHNRLALMLTGFSAASITGLYFSWSKLHEKIGYKR